VEQLGGKAAPAAGFAMGVERLLALWHESGGSAEKPVLDVYVLSMGDEAARFAFRVSEGLRASGFTVLHHCGGASFKSQMKKADGSGALFAAIIGDDEARAGEVSLKSLRSEGAQVRMPLDELPEYLAQTLYGMDDDDGGI